MSQISLLMLFWSEKELFSWTYLLKKTPQWTKILISPVWNKILKIWDAFWAHTNRSTTPKKYFNFFYHKKLELLEIIGKRISKNHVKNWKKSIWYSYRVYLLCPQFSASGSFLQKCINFVEQQLKLFSLWR